MNKTTMIAFLIAMQLANHAYAGCHGCYGSAPPRNFSTSQSTSNISTTIGYIKTGLESYKRLLRDEQNTTGVTDDNAANWREVLSATNAAESMGVNVTMGIEAKAFCLYRADMTGVNGYEITYRGSGLYTCRAYTNGGALLSPLELSGGIFFNTTPRLKSVSDPFLYRIAPEPPAAGTQVNFICATFSEGLSSPKTCDPNQFVYAAF